MISRETKKNLLYAIGASIAVVVAVVAGLILENVNIVPIGDTLRSFVFLTVVAVVGPILCSIIHRSLMPIFPVALYSLFQLRAISDLMPPSQFQSEMAVAILAIVLLGAYLLFLRMDTAMACRAVFWVGGTMAVSTIALTGLLEPTLLASASPPVIGEDFRRQTSAANSAYDGSPEKLPDIIYVIPDRYPNHSTLLREYRYDNSPFYDLLRDRGFVLAEDSWANYPKTFQSIASTFNGAYLDGLMQTYGSDTANQRPVYQLIEHNIVQEQLRSLGYRYVHFGNWWPPTRQNQHADENYTGISPNSLLALPRFEHALLEKTQMPRVIQRLHPELADSCLSIKRQFGRLRSIGNESRPVFVFAHLFIPHPPILATADGECLKRPFSYSGDGTPTWEQFKAGFIQYLQYFNSEIISAVDAQLDRRGGSGRSLVFVIQSDEGPYPKVFHEDKDDDFYALSDDEVRMKLGIINAVRIPSGGPDKGDSLLTPINNWRIVLGSLFNFEFDRLPHKSYIYRDSNHIFEFRDMSTDLGLPDVVRSQGTTVSDE